MVTKPAAVMQRTTNDKQPRRLIVAMVDPMVVSEWRGFVTENHTIVLTADDAERLELAVALLNTAAVDARYRRRIWHGLRFGVAPTPDRPATTRHVFRCSCDSLRRCRISCRTGLSSAATDSRFLMGRNTFNRPPGDSLEDRAQKQREARDRRIALIKEMKSTATRPGAAVDSPAVEILESHPRRDVDAYMAAPLSANITETPATFGISVGRVEVKTDDRRERLDDIG